LKNIFKNKKGEANQFHSYIIIFLGIALFSISLYAFAVGFIDLNYIEEDYTNPSISNNYINLTGLNDTVAKSNERANAYKNIFGYSSVTSSITAVTSVWGTVKSMWNIVTEVFSILDQASQNVLHIPGIVISSIFLILIILMIFAAWRVIKTGGWF